MKVKRFFETISNFSHSMLFRQWIALAFCLGISSTVQAQSSTPILYQARILKPDGNPVQGNVTMQFVIKSPGGCILWAENKLVNVQKGAVSEEVGSGINLATGGATFANIFLNTGTLSGLSGCTSGTTYNPGANDERILAVSFNDGSGVNVLPSLPVRSVPFAHYASMARSVLGIMGVDIDTTTAPTNGQVLQFNSGANKWEAAAVGTGSVTNVGLDGGTIFNVTGGPVTTSGTFTLAFANQAQNLVLASPNGSTGVPTFRAMVAADIPNLPAAKITSGTLSAAVGGTGLVPAVGDANKVYGVNAAGTGTEFKTLNPGTGITIDQTVAGVVTISANNSGSVTHVGTGTGLTGGPITGVGTISLATTTVGAGSFGTASSVGTFIVDAYGRLTGAGNVAIALNANQITSGTLSTAQLGTIDGSSLTNIAAGSITSGTLSQAALGTYLGSIAASQVNSGTLAQAQLGVYLGGLNGSQITAGTIDTARLGSIPFSLLNGTISTAQLGLIDGSSLTNIAGSSITSGTIGTARLGTFDASMTTTGTFALARLGTLPFTQLTGTISTAQLGLIDGSSLTNIAGSSITSGTISQAALGTYLGNLVGSQITTGTLDTARLGSIPFTSLNGTISTAQLGLIDGSSITGVAASSITSGTFNQSVMGTYLGTIGAAQVIGGTLSQAVLGTYLGPFSGYFGGTIAASQVTLGTMNQAQLGTYLGTLDGSQITSGTLSQAALGTYLGPFNGLFGGTISAAQITLGTMNQAQLGVFDADKTVSGTFAIARLGSIPFTSLNGTISTAQLGLIDGSSITGVAASSITSGTFNQSVMGTYLGTIGAAQVIGGTLSQAVLGTYLGPFSGYFGGTIAASQVTLGTMNQAQLGVFDADKTVSGTFAIARLGSIPFTSLNGTISQAQLGQIDGSAITSVAASSITTGTFNQSVMGTYLGTIGAAQVIGGTLSQAVLGTYLGSLSAAQTTSGTFDLARLGVLPFTQLSGTISVAQAGTYLGILDASQITTGTLSQAVLGTYLGSFGGAFSGTIGAHQITGGTLNQAQLGTYLGILDASQTTTGTFAQARLGTYLGTLDGSQITTGTLDTARLGSIPFTSLNGTISQAQLGQIDGSAITSVAASSITSGTFNQSVMGTYLGTIGAAQVIGGTLSQAVLGTYLGPFSGYFGGTIAASQVTLGTMNQAQLGTYLGNIDGSQITSGTLSQAALGTYLGAFGGAFTGTIGAHQITGGTMNHAQLGNILAAQVVGGTLSQAVLGTYLGPFNGQFGGTISAAQITLGTMNQAQLGNYLGALDASQTTTGTFSQAVLGTYLGTIGAAQVIGGTLSQAVLGTYLGPFGGSFTGTIAASQVTAGTLDTARLGAIPNSITTGTSANTANTLVLRDGTGGFAAGTVSVAAQDFVGAGTAKILAPTAGNYTLILPTTPGTAGQVLTTNGTAGALAWTNGTTTFPLLANPQGTAGAPAYSFSTTTNTGMYSTGVGTLAITTAGTMRMSIDNLGRMFVGNGSSGGHGDALSVDGVAQAWGFYAGSSNPSSPAFGNYNGEGIFFPGSTDLGFSTDTIERMRILANGSVGIGTTNPLAKLEIAGDLRIRSAGGSVAINGPASGNYSLTLPPHPGGSGQVLSSTGTSGVLSWVSGVAPTFPLLANPQGTAGAPAYSFSTTTNTGMYSTGVGTLALSTAGTNVVTVTNLGRVGIGTTTPRSLLHQFGPDPMWSLTNVNDVPDAGLFIGNSYNSASFGIFNDGGGMYAGTLGPGEQRVFFAYDYAGRVGSTTHQFDTAMAYRNLLDDGSGKAAIGTTSPTAQLHVVGDIKWAGTGSVGIYPPTAGNYTMTWPSTPGVSGQTLITSGTGGILSWGTPVATPSFPLLANPQGTAGAPAYSFSTSTNTGMYSTGVGTLAFSTAGTNALTINNLGYVGIGTTNPTQNMNIVGTTAGEVAVVVQNNSSNALAYANLSLANDGGTSNFGEFGLGSTNYSIAPMQNRLFMKSASGLDGLSFLAEGSGDVRFFTTGGYLERARITNAGSFGIGTTSPTAKLQVQGDIKWAGAGSVGIYAPIAGNYTMTWPSTPGVSGQTLITSGTGGILSWGTPIATPSFPLQANPQGSAATPAYSFSNTTNTGVFSTGVGTLAFSTAGTQAVTIDNLGNVGIGTSAPSANLHVVGDIVYTGSITDVSDRRLKENIQPLGSGLSVINQIPTYSYSMKDDPKSKTEFGVMAQEVREILPELVRSVDPNKDYMGVNYQGFIPWLIKSVQELDHKIENSCASVETLAKLKSDNDRLERRVQSLESEMQEMREQMKKLMNRSGNL